ncbi:hypothetical protein LZZ85_21880 [Terrimonas sp. NA20]|uniref:Uncharacterized protein n=1 Tax=Terrimonas ginsenosidimutans TaxID=2908004 RepID=A0ABS9KX92_9BACT|nr:hypothetical protein [Terrimonas ginsenosidimutans]MCG2616962.1 hypothetical protein [Terrimonas ginsenosidimutans]
MRHIIIRKKLSHLCVCIGSDSQEGKKQKNKRKVSVPETSDKGDVSGTHESVWLVEEAAKALGGQLKIWAKIALDFQTVKRQ